MEMSAAIFSITVAIALGAMSPGPSFVMVARTAVAVSRKDALAAAVGMGVGAVFFSLVALFGLLALIAAVPLLYLAFKVAGGAYLLYLGYRIWQGARHPLRLRESPQDQASSVWRSFAVGLATQVSNPKAAVVYASVFASLLPREVPPFATILLPVLMFVIETTWYAVVALALSAESPRAHYLASKAWIDRSTGAVMSVLGAKLIFM